jgi:recombination protein RecR
MLRNDNPIERLIDLMARLPGLGPRSARRAVLHLIRKRALLLAPLAEAMAEVAQRARECLNCGNVGTSDICDICQNESRANGLLCVVEEVADLWAMERGWRRPRGSANPAIAAPGRSRGHHRGYSGAECHD